MGTCTKLTESHTDLVTTEMIWNVAHEESNTPSFGHLLLYCVTSLHRFTCWCQSRQRHSEVCVSKILGLLLCASFSPLYNNRVGLAQGYKLR